MLRFTNATPLAKAYPKGRDPTGPGRGFYDSTSRKATRVGIWPEAHVAKRAPIP